MMAWAQARATRTKNGPVIRPARCIFYALERDLPPPPVPVPLAAMPTATTTAAAAPTAAAVPRFRGHAGRDIDGGGQAGYANGGSNGRPDRADAPKQGNRRGCHNLREQLTRTPCFAVGAGGQKAISHSVHRSFLFHRLGPERGPHCVAKHNMEICETLPIRR